MDSTAEVRWFYRGPVPDPAIDWFERGGHPGPVHSRTDYYLVGTGAALGVKLREGNLEFKLRHRQYGDIRLHAEVVGTLEQWYKWSIPLRNLDPTWLADISISRSWAAVHKARRQKRYARAAGQILVLSPDTQLDAGCDVELTRVRAADQDWWTLGYEAFGPPDNTMDLLLRVLGFTLVQSSPPHMQAEHSYGYAEWLERQGMAGKD